MKSFRQLCSVIIFTLVLAMSALAGETNTPPGCAPGETHSPPCFASQGETQGPHLNAPEGETSLLNVLLFGIQSILPG